MDILNVKKIFHLELSSFSNLSTIHVMWAKPQPHITQGTINRNTYLPVPLVQNTGVYEIYFYDYQYDQKKQRWRRFKIMGHNDLIRHLVHICMCRSALSLGIKCVASQDCPQNNVNWHL